MDVESRRKVEKGLRRKFFGTKPWLPRLQELRDKRKLWGLIIWLKSGYVVKKHTLKRLIRKTGKMNAATMSIEEAKLNKELIEKEYNKLDEEWVQERLGFLYKLDKENAKKKYIGKCSKKKSRVTIEKQRIIGRIIKQTKRKSNFSVRFLIATEDDGKRKG